MSKRLIGLHCFNWTFNGIKENAEKIKESGYDYILVSPVQGQKEMDWEWWKLYQPIRFGFADTVLGNKEEQVKEDKKVETLKFNTIGEFLDYLDKRTL